MGRQFGNLSDGDVHFWAVWWGGMRLEAYEHNMGLFNTEFGMQSFLPMATMNLFLPAIELMHVNTAGIIHHNSMHAGLNHIHNFTDELFGQTESLENYAYLSICMQAWGVGKRIHALRQAMPHTMGSLFWQ